MFDLLAHWFAKTEIINNGTRSATPYKKGHFSLDLTIICFIVTFFALAFLYRAYSKRQSRYKNLLLQHNIPLKTIA